MNEHALNNHAIDSHVSPTQTAVCATAALRRGGPADLCDRCPVGGARTSEETDSVRTLAPPAPTWGDQLLVQACLGGDQRAWASLLGRYERLVRSIARRYGASPSDAGDVFQVVCIELVLALPKLRNQESVRSWIATIAAHQAHQWKRRHTARIMRERDDPEVPSAPSTTGPLHAVEQAERERLVREGLRQLAPRCQTLLGLLFFQDPPVPYLTIADRLGMAAGSVGFVRARCLRRLKRALERAGVSVAAAEGSRIANAHAAAANGTTPSPRN